MSAYVQIEITLVQAWHSAVSIQCIGALALRYMYRLHLF